MSGHTVRMNEMSSDGIAEFLSEKYVNLKQHDVHRICI